MIKSFVSELGETIHAVDEDTAVKYLKAARNELKTDNLTYIPDGASTTLKLVSDVEGEPKYTCKVTIDNPNDIKIVAIPSITIYKESLDIFVANMSPM